MAKSDLYPAQNPVGERSPQPDERGAWLQLLLGGAPYQGEADVRLGDLALTGRGAGVFADDVPPGSYRLAVRLKDPDLVVPERTIEVHSLATALRIDVLSAGAPVLRIGGEPAAFRPVPGRVGVTLPAGGRPAGRAAFAEAVERELGLRRVDPDTGRNTGNKRRAGARLAFALPEGKLPDRELIAALGALTEKAGVEPGQARIGAIQAAPTGSSAPQFVVDDQFFVGFPHDASDATVGEVLRRLEAVPLRSVDRCPPTWRVRLAGAADPDGFAGRLAQLADLVEKGVLTFAEPALPVFGEPAGPTTALPAQVNLINLGVPSVWAMGITGAGAVVGHIDSPVVTSHPGVRRNGTPWGEHIVLAGASGTHGTRTFGLISAQGDGGLWGIAPDASVVSIGIPLQAGAQEDLLPQLVDALRTCNDRLARVVSMSFTYPTRHLPQPVRDQLDALTGRGALVIKAAGNNDKLLVPTASETLNPGEIQDALCDHPMVICVSDVTTTDSATLSNRGPTVDFCAQGSFSLTLRAAGGTTPFGESSAATAIVAATLALMISAKPTITRDQALNLLADTAVRPDPTNAAWTAVRPSWSAVDRLHHHRFGFGRINTAAAVTAAQALP